jgi:hypothetical protein
VLDAAVRDEIERGLALLTGRVRARFAEEARRAPGGAGSASGRELLLDPERLWRALGV